MTKSCVYLIELETPIGSARHTAQTYIGYADDGNWERRLNEHRTGRGSRMLAFAAAKGIAFNVVAVFSGDRKLERGLKNQGHGMRLFANVRAGRRPECVTYTHRDGHKEIIAVPAPIFLAA